MELVDQIVVSGLMTLPVFLDEFEDELYVVTSVNRKLRRRAAATDWFDAIRILLGG